MIIRPRRLRQSEAIRKMTQEAHLSVNDLIAPLFIDEGENKVFDINSMPGYKRYTLDLLQDEIAEIVQLGIKSVLLFANVQADKKDNEGTEASNPDGLMQKSIREIKKNFPDLLVMSDVALDPYSSYGHDGIVKEGKILNDETVEVLARMSVSHAEAGVDFVAPSDMMDGRIYEIRVALEENGYPDTGIMSYSAKYASSLYGPFRNALDSSPAFGDKKSYQMDYHNKTEAIKETILDIQEGADIVMVKPGLAYLDIINELSKVVEVPISAYHVSGEYAMIQAAAEKGYIDKDTTIIELTTAFKRAGASLIATYFSKDIARLLRQI